MRYAVNAADLLTFQQQSELFPPFSLLRPILSTETVSCEHQNWDGDAILIKPDTSPERWQAIVKIIREGAGNRKGIPKWALRLYESKTGKGSWRRI